jgi:hypothetical protein
MNIDEVKAIINKHCPRISRLRLMVLLTIAACFIWVLMGARRGQA